MSFPRTCLLALALGAPLLLTACGQDPTVRGYVLDERALEQIKPGSSAESVILVLGTPSVVSTVGGKGYYYITQKLSQRYQFMQQTITDQRVLAVHLDAKNKVERVANYGLEDGKLFDFITRRTPTGGDELSFVRQLLRASNLSAPGAGPGQPGQ
ncbi:MAG TPA: outer membrane protein assembly factor BamE [Beijerinckiaceae bacterium]|nr:outer membrane protein assembly factor BamE [Beijerinckiaceae bacterium]